MLSNPPFGVEWKKVEKVVRKENDEEGYNGRFGPGLPRVSDGSLLFLLHLISKMRPAVDGGSRFGIVLNGSPLFTGGAGSGESEIRRYVLENDLVEAIIGLPTDMFYNTGISTYVWILSNRKPANRKGKVQLIDASGYWQKMRKSLGSKRKELSDEHIAEITRIFGNFRKVTKDGVPISRIFKNEEFGYRTITVERPLKDNDDNVVLVAKGKNKGDIQPDSDLRDTENVPLNENVEVYFEREVLPTSSAPEYQRNKGSGAGWLSLQAQITVQLTVPGYLSRSSHSETEMRRPDVFGSVPPQRRRDASPCPRSRDKIQPFWCGQEKGLYRAFLAVRRVRRDYDLEI
jgi:type I restriction enzyme M protein